ncbi:MAG: hypothetical protein HC901_03385 [Bdellovibrionaceae bacterium]|nr:hypothetical protein [Pseudobdellovibrionaceae bacterium]
MAPSVRKRAAVPGRRKAGASARRGQFILFQATGLGTPVEVAVEYVRSCADVDLVSRSRDALLVEGIPASIRSIIDRLSGWRVERNRTAAPVGRS